MAPSFGASAGLAATAMAVLIMAGYGAAESTFPATTAKGTYTESSAENGQRFGEVSCELKGPNDADKGDLLSTTMAVCMGKLEKQLQRDEKSKNWIGSITVSESLYE